MLFKGEKRITNDSFDVQTIHDSIFPVPDLARRREEADAIAGLYRLLGQGYERKAIACAHCGETVIVAQCPADGTRRLLWANFCRVRMCPMCTWRRSVKLRAHVSAVLHEALRRYPKWSLVMLTLTQRNVTGPDLRDEITRVLQAWRRLSRRDDLRSVMGWFRALEVTHNDRSNTWHPHVHALLLVRSDYWTRGYISHQRWCQLWAQALRVDYTPIVDVHRVRPRGRRNTLDAAAAELSKYTVKPMDVIQGDDTDAADRLQIVDDALRSRRLVAFGGELQPISRALKDMPAPDEASPCDDPKCPVCGAVMERVRIGWERLARRYVIQAYLSKPTDDTEPSTRP